MTSAQGGRINKRIVAVLAALALLVIIAVGIWLVFFQPKEVLTADQPITDTKSTPKLPPEQVNYLTIMEWGIKLPLENNTKDADYFLQDGAVYLTTKSVQKACKLTETPCSIITLTRSDTSQSVSMSDDENSGTTDGTVKFEQKLGDWYYQFDESNEEGWRYQFADDDIVSRQNVVAAQDAFLAGFQQLALK